MRKKPAVSSLVQSEPLIIVRTLSVEDGSDQCHAVTLGVRPKYVDEGL
jgi:hypothetical protein